MLKPAIRLALVIVVILTVIRTARAADEKKVRSAADHAVAYLTANFDFDNDATAWPLSRSGARDRGIALCGVALLEAKIHPTHPVLAIIAKNVRAASIDEDRTINLALDIIFLDKLNDPGDLPLIQSMAARLIVGQSCAGGWSEFAPALDPIERQRMLEVMRAAARKRAAGVAIETSLNRPRLDPKMRDILEGKHIIPLADTSDSDDNFNTLFATLAVWTARRYGVPAEALNKVQVRFRSTQLPDGGWLYRSTGPDQKPTPQMTCAGILGLTAANGIQRERILKLRNPDNVVKPRNPPTDPRTDPQIQKGLAFLSQTINDKRFGEVRDDLFALWSIESVAAALNLESFGGNRKWTDWGYEWLLRKQNADGSFDGKWGKRADTSFALMFLLRANLMRDLTHLLKSNKVIDVVEAPEPPPAPPEKPKEAPPAPEPIVTPIPCQPVCQPCPCYCCPSPRRFGICGFLRRWR